MKRSPFGLLVMLGWLSLSLVVTLFLLGFAVAEIFLLVLCAPGLIRAFGPPLGFGLFFLGAVAALALAVAVHEGGHVLAARLVGLSTRFAHVGPVTFTKRFGRWRLGWDSRQPWLGGRAVCDLRVADRARTAAFLAGGPAANLLAGGAALGLAVFSSSPLPQTWAGQAALLSLFFAALNLLPFREARVDSDGLALWRVLFGPRP